jgi:uncharacterized membrane protein
MILFALSPVIFFAISWNSFPETTVLHFALNKEFENIQTRSELLVASAVLSGLSIFIYLVMLRLHKVDPKVTAGTPRSAFNKLGVIICIFITVLNFCLVLTAKNQWIISSSVMIAFTGLFIFLIGNYMNNIRPNYVAGIRLPWTLNDPENWRKTHHLASRMWFVAGILIMAGSFLINEKIMLPIMIANLVLIAVIPGIYSFKIYRSKK